MSHLPPVIDVTELRDDEDFPSNLLSEAYHNVYTECVMLDPGKALVFEDFEVRVTWDDASSTGTVTRVWSDDGTEDEFSLKENSRQGLADTVDDAVND